MEISHPDSKTKKCVLSSYSINTILGEHLEPWLLAFEPLTVKSLKIYIWLTGIKSVKIKKKISLRVCLFPDDLYYSLRKKTEDLKNIALLHYIILNLINRFISESLFLKFDFLTKLTLSLKYANFANIVFINCIRLTLILLRQQYLQTKRYQFLKKYLG